MAKSNEPAVWSLFSAGGVVAALFIPVTLALTAIAVPAGWLSAEGLRELAGHPLARLFLFAVISLPMFHWAHRFRYAAADLGLKRFPALLAITCYTTAVAATAAAGFYLAAGLF